MIQPILKTQLGRIEKLFREHKVKRAFAFGSVCTDHFSDKSDIDLLISFQDDQIAMEDYADNYFDLVYKLEEILGREVDLITERTVKNQYFLNVVERTKTPIFHG
ncbi:MAG: nucleotidyltransferase family protein [Cyclobacteriaceae bacterium]|jgi:predicted nucleotidyltransferase